MIDKDKLAQLIADADMLEEEKIGWVRLAEFMNEDELQQLMDTLQSEQDKLSALRSDYIVKIDKLLIKEAV